MKKLNIKEIRKITDELKSFWKKYRELEFIHSRAIENLEKEMNKKLNLGMELEFFYCDGECCGIGAKEWKKRKKFPLVHDNELEMSSNLSQN